MGRRYLDLERSRNIPVLEASSFASPRFLCICTVVALVATCPRHSNLLHPWEQIQLGGSLGLILVVGELHPTGVRTVWSHVPAPCAGAFAKPCWH